MSAGAGRGSEPGAGPADAAPRRTVARVVLLGGLCVAFAGFIALGAWQVQRLGWKNDLIQRVDARVAAAPVPVPDRAGWPWVDAAHSEYLHVVAEGRYIAGADTRVQAVTSIGAGAWLLSPLRQDDGSVVLVNRGFVAPGAPAQAPAAAATADAPAPRTRVTGLLRLTEPNGGFLRRNAPAEGRWYSRDVQAIAAAHRLGPVAPYFIDADVDPTADRLLADGTRGPVGGLTVIRFPNHHLQYALTWFALALMVAFAAWRVLRYERQRRVP